MVVLDWGKIVRHNQNLHHPIFVNHPVLDTLWKITVKKLTMLR